MRADVHTVELTTAADGTATGYTPVVSGRVWSITYAKTDFAAGVDFTITAERAGETLWTEADVNASKTVLPRAATHSTAGVAALYAAGGAAVLEPFVVANDRVKIAVAQGGASKVGTFYVTVA